MKRVIVLLLFVCLLCSSILLHAQRITVKGYVYDADNHPIELAHVRVSSQLVGSFTNLKGYYEFQITPTQDTLSITFSCLGYKTVVQKLPQALNSMQLDMRMYYASRELQQVVVTDNRRQSNTMQKIDVGKTRLMPDASGGSIENLLTTFAGVNSNNELSSQYSVRGGNYDENSVYVNGIEVYRPLLVRSGQQEGLSFINPDMVAGISFSSGGYGAEYGDKMSSVLDITYKRPDTFEGSVSVGFLGSSASVGHRYKGFTQLHGIRYKTNSMLLSSLDTKGEYDPSFFDYQTYLTYTFSSKMDISFLGNIAINDYNFKPQERNTTFGTLSEAKQFKVYFDGQESDRFDTYFGAFTLNYHPTQRSTISLLASAFGTREEVTYDIAGQYWLDELDLTGDDKQANAGTLGVGTYHEHARNKLGAQVYALALKGKVELPKHTLQGGINVQRELIKDRVGEWEMRDSAGYSLPHTANGVEMIYNLHAQNQLASTRLSAHVQDTYKLRTNAGLFSFTAGLRAAYWDYNKEFIVSPRLSAAFFPKSLPGLTVRAATGVYYQAPFFKEFRDTVRDDNRNMIVQLNPQIRSQRSIHYVIGGDYSFRAIERRFKVTTELYYKQLSDLVPYEVDNVRIWYYGRNMSKGYTAGIDMKFFGEFVPGTDSWISVSLMQAKEELRGVTVPRPTEQRYSLALYFQDYVPGLPKYKFNLRAIWADGLPFAAPRRGRDEGYFRSTPYRRIDIGASRQLVGGEDKLMQNKFFRHFKSIWIGIDVFNLFNISNINSYYWVTDVYNNQFAIPNFLTMRQINLRLSIDF